MPEPECPPTRAKALDKGVLLFFTTTAAWLLEKAILRTILSNELRNLAGPAVIAIGIADAVLAVAAVWLVAYRRKELRPVSILLVILAGLWSGIRALVVVLAVLG